MLNMDEIDPPQPIVKKLDLAQMSIHELKAHILMLEAEIEQAQAIIRSKETHRADIESLFSK